MNIRDYIVPFILALATLFLVRSWWFGSSQDSNVGFIAPLTVQEQEPLRTEVDFVDQEKDVEGQDVVVQAAYADLIFSSRGASLTHAVFKRIVRNEVQTFKTIDAAQVQDEQRMFLVALDEKTPLAYSLQERIDTDNETRVIYKVHAEVGTIQKEFVVYKNKCAMDVIVTIDPKNGSVVRPRLYWNAPYLQAIEAEEQISGVIFDKTGNYSKKSINSLNPREGFFAPTIFGSENKYFLHALIKDEHNFASRAYYKLINHSIVSIIEAQPVTARTTWAMSFYMGPKEVETFALVEPRLEKVLDYGFFSPVAKGMLYLLKLCNHYVHNFGLAIILITLLLKLLLLPFTFKGEQKARKAEAYYKKLAYLQQRYKDDPQALNAAREELVRTEGMPGLGGCLPLLLQIPFFMGLSGALNNSIELYRAPFILWIKDLSVKDPYYVLPVLIGIGFLLVMLNSKQNGGFKQVVASGGMALLFAAWMSTTAAGLALFIVFNVFLHFIQTRIQKAVGL